jgi:hypothetical protein
VRQLVSRQALILGFHADLAEGPLYDFKRCGHGVTP